MNSETKETKRQIEVELNHLEDAAIRAVELLSDLENKLERVMMPITEGTDDEDTEKYKEVCDIAHSMRLSKDKIMSTNERLSDIINRIEL
ncbi:hypothetical protein LCGC14_2601460 [marine sediment metagenome]|uniref:Uncharacterized protein n=1 Tax=marine sediment metagenome TaxID=412755 RepID=A0A0F9D1C5_9ZZZZ